MFDIREDALNREIFLHEKFDVGVNKKFYNRSKQTKNGFDRLGTTMTQDQIEHLKSKIREQKITGSWEKKCKEHSKRMMGSGNSFYGKKHTEETKCKISETKKGKIPYIMTPERNKKLSNSLKEKYKKEGHHWTGRKHTKETLEKMRRPHTKQKRFECVYCGRIVAQNMLSRWHMNNCKNKIE